MATYQIILPSLGEGVIEATITRWLKKIGDSVQENEPVVEIATDKVDSEIISSYTGILTKILAQEGQIVAVDSAVAEINNEEALEETQKETPKTKEVVTHSEAIAGKSIDDAPATIKVSKTKSGKFLSPLVRAIAVEQSISLDDLDKLSGTGIEHRITKDDVLTYLAQKKNSDSSVIKEVSAPTHVQHQTPQPTKIHTEGNFELVEMDRIRKIIADAMVNSKKTAPHVTSFVEIDVTNLVLWRNKIKDDFLKKHFEKITYTPIFLEVAAQALREFPMVNTSLDGHTIIVKKNINIGMATALPSGNLIVPVIKNADQYNLAGLTKQVNDLANRARLSKLQPSEIQGGTFTITNLGTFGNITGTPIINQPESAILAIGAIKKKPAVIETPTGDVIGIRHIMILSLSYDHRIIDGALGGMFLKRIGDLLEEFDFNRAI